MDIYRKRMEYFDRLKEVGESMRNSLVRGMVDTVFSVQNSMKDVLPGNPLVRTYELKQQIGSAGPCGIWKIFSARRKTTKEEASIFVLEKRSLDKFGKSVKERLCHQFRKAIQQLTCMRHPNILSVQHQLEECRDSFAFATEPVQCSLYNVLHGFDKPNPDNWFLQEPLTDLEIKYGLLQVCDALKFLHNDAKIVHRNLCPESVFIVAWTGAWKLAGLEFCIKGTMDPGQTKAKYECQCFVPEASEISNPNLNFAAPESMTAAGDVISGRTDIFSLGCLLRALYNNGESMYDCHSNYRQMKNDLEQLKTSKQTNPGKIPSNAVRTFNMLVVEHSRRPAVETVLKEPMFAEVGVKTLEYLDSLFQVDDLQRSMFYKTLPKIIPNLPMRINLQRLMSSFALEFINLDMIPFILPNVFLIAERCNDKQYSDFVFTRLKQIFGKPMNTQTLAILMKNMQLMLKKTNSADVQEHILPVLYNALDSNAGQVQDMCLQIIPSFAGLVDASSMRSSILPRIRRICIETTVLSIRVNCLICIGRLVEQFDKWMFLDDIIPILVIVPSREPSVLMAILGIVKVALAKLDTLPNEALANKIIPLLSPLCIESSLNIQQFEAYMQLIRDVLDVMERGQRSRLEQLSHFNVDEIHDPLRDYEPLPENDKVYNLDDLSIIATNQTKATNGEWDDDWNQAPEDSFFDDELRTKHQSRVVKTPPPPPRRQKKTLGGVPMKRNSSLKQNCSVITSVSTPTSTRSSKACYMDCKIDDILNSLSEPANTDKQQERCDKNRTGIKVVVAKQKEVKSAEDDLNDFFG